jgi:hypothetical protein
LGANYQEPARLSKVLTPGELNRAISKTVDFVNDKYQDPISGWRIFHKKRRVITNAKIKQKGRLVFTMFYLIIEKKGLNLWDDLERSNPTLR